MPHVEEILHRLADAVDDCEKENALALVETLLCESVTPKTIIQKGLLTGIEIVKDKFSRLEYFLPELIMASEVVQASVDRLIASMSEQDKKELLCGTVVIGTPKGDIHDVGKNIFATLLIATGFTVFDIGIDRPVESFIEKAEEVHADIIAVSCLMTTSLVQPKELIEDLERLGLRSKYKVIFGGGAMQPTWSYEAGADGYALEASEGVGLAKKLVRELREEVASCR